MDVPALEVDYSNVEALRDILQSNNVSTVISTLDMIAGTESEMALIKAADLSSTTRRFIPSSWGLKYTPE